MTQPTDKRNRVKKAEQSVVRAAMGCVNARGWAMESDGAKCFVIFPKSMVRLEAAVMRLRVARKGKR